jgi:hypothetical protein
MRNQKAKGPCLLDPRYAKACSATRRQDLQTSIHNAHHKDGSGSCPAGVQGAEPPGAVP